MEERLIPSYEAQIAHLVARGVLYPTKEGNWPVMIFHDFHCPFFRGNQCVCDVLIAPIAYVHRERIV